MSDQEALEALKALLSDAIDQSYQPSACPYPNCPRRKTIVGESCVCANDGNFNFEQD